MQLMAQMVMLKQQEDALQNDDADQVIAAVVERRVSKKVSELKPLALMFVEARFIGRIKEEKAK